MSVASLVMRSVFGRGGARCNRHATTRVRFMRPPPGRRRSTRPSFQNLARTQNVATSETSNGLRSAPPLQSLRIVRFMRGVLLTPAASCPVLAHIFLHSPDAHELADCEQNRPVNRRWRALAGVSRRRRKPSLRSESPIGDPFFESRIRSTRPFFRCFWTRRGLKEPGLFPTTNKRQRPDDF